MTPNRLGPTLFLPASVVWQSAHFLKSVLPASTSPAAAIRGATKASTSIRAEEPIGKRILSPARSSISRRRLCHIHAACSLQNKVFIVKDMGLTGALLDEPNAVRYE